MGEWTERKRVRAVCLSMGEVGGAELAKLHSCVRSVGATEHLIFLGLVFGVQRETCFSNSISISYFKR